MARKTSIKPKPLKPIPDTVYIKVIDAAGCAGMSVRDFRRYVEAGELRAFKLREDGLSWLVTNEFRDWLGKRLAMERQRKKYKQGAKLIGNKD